MPMMRWQSIFPAGTALAVLAFCFLVAPAAQGEPGAWGTEFPHEFSSPEAKHETDPEGPSIREPIFAFLVALTEADSLGTWEARDIAAYADSLGASSAFPVEDIVRLVRRRPLPAEQRTWPLEAVRAVWEITLNQDLDRPMPYSILGYNPGSLRISRHLLLTETRAGILAFSDGSDTFLVHDVVMFRLDKGYLVLDVDGLVDRLLGKALDDSGTIGFVLAREQDRLIGLAVSLGRNGRRIYGEFDFRKDKVLPNGRPLARGLSAACRGRMLADYPGPPLGRWVDGR